MSPPGRSLAPWWPPGILHECHHVAFPAATIPRNKIAHNVLRAPAPRRRAPRRPDGPGGLGGRIDLRLGPALDTLRALPAGASFDLAFIDADKPGYAGYWQEIVPRIRPGGVILVDNTLLHGRIFLPEPDPAVADDRVVLAMLPVGDGLTVARRK